MVLDLMLPGEDGLSICRRLRGAGDETADHHAHRQGRRRRPHRRPRDGRRRLPAQAVQPARARGAHPAPCCAGARRHAPPGAPATEHAGRRVRRLHAQPRHAHASRRAASTVPLTTGEFSLLKVLAQHPRQPLSRDKLMELARGREYEVFDRSIDVQISRLRKLIEPDPSQSALHPDRLGLRLRVHPGRPAALVLASFARDRSCAARAG